MRLCVGEHRLLWEHVCQYAAKWKPLWVNPGTNNESLDLHELLPLTAQLHEIFFILTDFLTLAARLVRGGNPIAEITLLVKI